MKLIDFDEYQIIELPERSSKLIMWYKSKRLVKEMVIGFDMVLGGNPCEYCLIYYGELVLKDENGVCPKPEQHCTCGHKFIHHISCPLGFDKYFRL